jgi:coenzyme F420-reducing hydrogenase alpha subunit
MMQKITIERVTRIEGHARVNIYLDEDGSVQMRKFLYPGEGI